MSKEKKSQTERSVMSRDLTCADGFVELIEVATFEKIHSFDYRVEVTIGTVKIMNNTLDSETEAYAVYHKLSDILANFVPA
ncbi:hypothetical protein KAR91_85435 [Candidatus Pacearchaeota archaeon]|nr:hypothetical protein [Candidatus Pacearchaeota archaeon]